MYPSVGARATRRFRPGYLPENTCESNNLLGDFCPFKNTCEEESQQIVVGVIRARLPLLFFRAFYPLQALLTEPNQEGSTVIEKKLFLHIEFPFVMTVFLVARGQIATL